MLFVWGGYFFGNIPWIKGHFGLVTIGVILISLIPLVGVVARRPATARVNG
jgi:membrane-associated protein